MDTVRKDSAAIVLGVLLVLGGIVFLLGNFGLFDAGSLIIALMFGAGGLAFLAMFATNTNEHWWALIPGFALLGIGSLIGLSELFPAAGGTIGAALLFGALAVAFLLIYILRTERWWAVIPGGVMLSLAVVILLSTTNLPFAGELSGSALFFGLALTFGLLYFLPTPQGQLKWAIYPAAGCALFGLITLVSMGGLMNYIWPAALIVGGLYLVYRNMNRRAM